MLDSINKETKEKLIKLHDEYSKILAPPQGIKLDYFHVSINQIMSAIINFTVVDINKDHFSIKPLVHLKKNINIANIIFNGKKKYFMYGDIPISADGEYRPNLLNLTQVDPIIAQHTELLKITKQYYIKNIKYISSPVDEHDTIMILAHVLSFVGYQELNGHSSNYNTDVRNLFQRESLNIPNAVRANRFYMPKIKTSAMGVKIIPLYINDVKLFNSNIQQIQREISANLLVRRLVVNGICNHFSLLIDWNIFHLENLEIFNNHDIISKYIDSKKYISSLEQLYKAGDIVGDVEVIHAFRKRIMVPITFAEKNLVLSDYCMMLISLYNGSTLANGITRYIKDPTLLKGINICASLPNARSLILQVTYALFSLNKHCHIMHGDLHLNNVTWFMRDMVKKSVYIINEPGSSTNSWYVDETLGYYTIIDFGRCYFDPEQLIAENYTQEYIKLQNKKISHYFAKILPDLYLQNKREISRHFITNPSKMYHICMGLDLYNFIKKIHTSIAVHLIPEVDDFFADVNKFIYSWIVENLEFLNKNMPIDEAFINQRVIIKFYDRVVEKSEITVNNYNNSNNSMKYDLHDIEISTNLFANNLKKPGEIAHEEKKLERHMAKLSKQYNDMFHF